MSKHPDWFEFTYKVATHALLGLITFLAVRIYDSVEQIKVQMHEHDKRIAIVEIRVENLARRVRN